MTKVVFYKSSDDQLHETHADMLKHESKLRLVQSLKEASFNLNAAQEDDRGNTVLFAEDVGSFIADNADLLRSLLNESMTRKYSKRKAKSEAPAVAA